MTEPIDLVYKPGPVTTKFHHDEDSRVKLLIGPFGTGKTTAAGWDIIDFQSERVVPTRGKKRSRFAVVRNTYPELRDTTIKTYLDWFPPLLFGKYNSTDKRYEMNIEDREIEILFKALDSPKDVRDLLSLELTGAHIDEAREVHRDVFKGLLGRVGRFPSKKDTKGVDPFVKPPRIVLTTNYPSQRHWLYKNFVSERVNGYSIYEQTQEENKHNLRKGYYEDLERDYADRPDLLRTLVRGSWGITVEGLAVYPEFIRSKHVSPFSLTPREPCEVFVGWDNTGLSPAVILACFNSWGQLHVFKEFCYKNTGIMDAAEAVILYCNAKLPPGCKYRHIADPSGRTRDAQKKSPADYMMEKGLEMGFRIFLEDGIQTFKVRRESVANRLGRDVNGQPSIIIDPSCAVLIEGFEGGYAYPEIATSGQFRKEPADNDYTHPHDALQYMCTRLFTSGMDEDETTDLVRMAGMGMGRSRVGGY